MGENGMRTLEEVLEWDRTYFEKHPDSEGYARIPHPDEWPVPLEMMYDMLVVIQNAEGFRTRFLVHRPGSWEEAMKLLR
ncbi:MAG: hypothetical protein MUO26_13450 [Methanotrichaceae archaeon]|nr:hypothetical protein [Methanotrichaceae archaeon]